MNPNSKSSTGQDNLGLKDSIFPFWIASQRQKVLTFLRCNLSWYLSDFIF